MCCVYVGAVVVLDSYVAIGCGAGAGIALTGAVCIGVGFGAGSDAVEDFVEVAWARGSAVVGVAGMVAAAGSLLGGCPASSSSNSAS